jgi:hypothetical protein
LIRFLVYAKEQQSLIMHAVLIFPPKVRKAKWLSQRSDRSWLAPLADRFMLLGVGGIMGLLAGSLASGFVLALMMANAGGAWDNAKKYIENGAYGGKGSFAHKAAVVGDMVGDPFKDTCGPSLDILIKLMSIVAVTMASLIAMVGQGGLFQLLLGGG